MPQLNGFVNLDEVETALADGFQKSVDTSDLELDLSNARWISAFSVTTLFSWMTAIRDLGGSVRLRPPRGISLASHFFAEASVTQKLDELGVQVISEDTKGPLLPERRKVAAFEVFASATAMHGYISQLSTEPQRIV